MLDTKGHWRGGWEASVQARLCTLLGQLEEVCGNSRKADRQFEMAIGILKDLGNRKN